MKEGESITLVDAEGDMLAVLDVTSVWRPDLKEEALKTFGTTELGNHFKFYFCFIYFIEKLCLVKVILEFIICYNNLDQFMLVESNIKIIFFVVFFF